MRTFRLLSLAALAAALLAPLAARAEYPDRPITVVIPLGAGGSHDLHARGITPILSEILGQPVVVSLVPGGAGMKGTTQVANANPDGYTIIFTHNAFDQLTPQTRKVEFDPTTAFKSIARINASEPHARRACRRAVQDAPRVHRLRQEKSRQGQHRSYRRLGRRLRSNRCS